MDLSPRTRAPEPASPGVTATEADALLTRLLLRCRELGASDLHITAEDRPWLRVEGRLRALEEPISAATVSALIDHLIGARDRDLLAQRGALDGALTGPKGGRFRWNLYRSDSGWSIALRRLADGFPPLRELGLPEAFAEVQDFKDGLVVVAGPTGAGKSTTLATLIDGINRTRTGHIVTIEDPVEFLHASIRCLIHQREIGRDADSFHNALVSALRQDPDVILVGEVRDHGTISTAITAAETGHLVLTTVHAGDVPGTLERMVSVFPSIEQPGLRRRLSLVLRAILAQRLLVVDGARRDQRLETAPDGMQRRVAVTELLMVTPAIRNLVAMGKSAQLLSTMETGKRFGMETLEQSLVRLFQAGLISESTAAGLARDELILRDRMRRATGRLS